MASQRQFQQLILRIEPSAKVIRHWQLTGGVSAQVFGLEMQWLDGYTQKLLLRIHGEVDRTRNPQIAADEFRLLRTLYPAGLAVPEPIFIDAAGEIFGTPALVIEFIEGSNDEAPQDFDQLTFQLAAELVKIHSLDCNRHDLSFLPKLDTALPIRPRQPDESLSEMQIRDALASFVPSKRANPVGLLHGDFWPGNILWKAGKLAAVIDWEDAQVGDPLADVANCRLELLWAFGAEAMEQFTRHYRSLSTIDFSDLHYWDLQAALRPAGKLGTWGLDPIIEQTMRERHHWFVESALKA